jgi:hypothetical protein
MKEQGIWCDEYTYNIVITMCVSGHHYVKLENLCTNEGSQVFAKLGYK